MAHYVAHVVMAQGMVPGMASWHGMALYDMALNCSLHWCAFVAGDVLHPQAAEMLGLLRRALLYFMRPDGQRVMDAAPDLAAAQEALVEYCTLASDYTGMRLCKYNSHVMSCRMAEQEVTRGGAASCSELYVERVVQKSKSGVRYRATSLPEVTMTRDVLLDHAIALCRMKEPGVKTFDQHVPQYRTAVGLNNPNAGADKIQDEADADGCLMIGYGARVMPGDSQYRQVVTAMRNMMKDIPGPMSEAGWDTEDLSWLEDTSFTKYKSADLMSAELVQGIEYRRARSRKSHYMVSHFYEADDQPPSSFLLTARYYVVAELQDRPDRTLVSKFAVGDMWRCSRVQGVIGSHWGVPDFEAAPTFKDWGVRLVDINRKVMIVHPTRVVHVGGKRYRTDKCSHRMFLEYSSNSRSQRNKEIDQASVRMRNGHGEE